MSTKSFDSLFITGCDSNTEWMLPWFLRNFYKHNKSIPIRVFDFGMTKDMSSKYSDIILPMKSQDKGWFKKPKTMLNASKLSHKVCWLDTDCHVLTNIEDIFERVIPNKLTMVEDKPWSNRRGEKWHNSGVVVFQDTPSILRDWVYAVAVSPEVGDQEVLHMLVREGMKRIIHIEDLPHQYNTLRLDLIDNTQPSNIKVMHWTGKKGKEHIQEILND